MIMKSESQVRADLDTMRDILRPLDDDGREGVLATIILWCAMHHPDRVAAITRLFDRVAEIENDIAREELQ
jgi:hypothetical protein